MSSAPGLCLFDLDDTLLPLDSDHAWGEFVVRLGWVDEAAFRRRNDDFYADYKAGRLDIHAYIDFATGPLRARPPAERDAAHGRFMAEVIAPAVRPAALDLVRRHQAQGDLCALVTATNDFITAPIAQAFGIDTLIAVRLERSAGGNITGRIAGTPSYRDGKVSRVNEWLGGLGRTLDDFGASASTATRSTTCPCWSAPAIRSQRIPPPRWKPWRVNAGGAS